MLIYFHMNEVLGGGGGQHSLAIVHHSFEK
jgi:hypothetical protein